MAKEKSITELRDEKRTLHDESKGIIEKARAENRALTAQETDTLNTNTLRMQEINTEIASRNYEVTVQQPKRGKFSLRRAIAAKMQGQAQRDTEAAVIAEGEALSRGIETDANSILIPVESRAAITVGASAGVVDTDYQEVLLPLQPNLVLSAAGAMFMTGLRGDIAWPSYSGTTVNWEGETDEAADGGGAITVPKTFKPKRLAAYVDISKQLLIQENTSVETIIRNSIAIAIAQKVEATALGSATTAAGVPDGLFTGYSAAEVELSWPNVVAMETTLAEANALRGKLAYIMHPALIGKAKTTVKDASGAGGFVFGNAGEGSMNGYRVLTSSNLPKQIGTGKKGYGAVFGNWMDYLVGQWGAIELIVDPYTQATKGSVRLVVNSYWDLGAIRDASFAKQAFDPTKVTAANAG